MKNLYNNIALVIFSLSVSGSLAAKEAGSSIDVFAAEIGQKNSAECKKPDGCLMFVGDGPLVSDLKFSFKVLDQKQPTIELELEKSVIDAINSTLKQRKDLRLAFMSGRKLIYAPVVKDRLDGNKVKLTFSNMTDFKRTLATLEEGK